MKLNSESLSRIAGIGFFLILCSKFYYLFGLDPQFSPSAPTAIVLIRDLLVFSFLLFFGFQLRHEIFKMRFFWALWAFGLGISLFQLSQNKDLATWAQHYFRNTLVPLLFYPVVYGLLRLKVQVAWRRILGLAFLLNITVNYLQIWLGHELVRPIGLYGDAIMNSTILFLGLAALATWGPRWLFCLGLFLLIPLVQLMGSFSALLSFVFGCAVMLILTFPAWKTRCRQGIQWLGPLTLVILICFFGLNKLMQENPQNLEGLPAKITYLYRAAFENGDGKKGNWSYQGRILSNLRPFSICRDSRASCLLGNIENPQYERIESTWASLTINWGAIFCFIYILWVLGHLRGASRFISRFQERDKDQFIWSLIFFTCLCFAAFNAIIYRYPLNILLYVSLAHLCFQTKNPGETASGAGVNVGVQ